MSEPQNNIRYSDDEWFVFEKTESGGITLKVNHFCGGKRINPNTGRPLKDDEDHESLRKWFHPTHNWGTFPACKACGKDVPEQTVMMVRLRNSNI